MPLFNRERMRPFLLDRLTDDEVVRRPGSVASATDRSLSPREYRRSVLRDLSWLLNSQAMPIREDIESFPTAAASVINFGIPDLCSLTVNGTTRAEIESMIRRAILRFEPRIMPNSLTVRIGSLDSQEKPGMMQLEIEADVWALPVPEALCVSTEIDLGSGKCVLRER